MTSPLEPAAAALLRVEALLGEAHEAQWQAGHSPVPLIDTTERSKGMTSDPVTHAMLDDRRIKLRAAVLEAEAAQADFMRVLGVAEQRLSAAQAGE
jgi:hypothetical protein